jgi:hypothetical protein
LPDYFPLETGPPGVDESEMILAGDVDTLITAITPKAYLDRHPKVKQLHELTGRNFVDLVPYAATDESRSREKC